MNSKIDFFPVLSSPLQTLNYSMKRSEAHETHYKGRCQPGSPSPQSSCFFFLVKPKLAI